MLTIADIYCGAGGLSAGFADAKPHRSPNEEQGFEIVFGIDNDPDAVETFRRHHFPKVDPERLEAVVPCKDIREATADSILDAIRPHKRIDVLIGGPNCQGVSAAGLRNPEDDRNQMLSRFIGLVRELEPQWFVMENVPGLVHANNHELLGAIFEEFEAIEGYRVSGDMLLAADFGVPQLRYRLFIVGTRSNAPIRFPRQQFRPPFAEGTQSLPGPVQTYRTVREAIGDLAHNPAEAYDGQISPHETNPPNHYYADISDVNRERIKAVPEGEDWRSMPIRLLPERYFATRASDQKGAYGRLRWDWPAYTVTNAANNVTAGPFTHPSEDRPISVREAARLQRFDDEHAFYGSILSQYRQIGNAVPPRLARAVAEAILYCHYCPDDARHWGGQGRLSSTLIRGALDDTTSIPTLTPRIIHPDHDRRRRKRLVPKQGTEEGDITHQSAWDAKTRPDDPHPKDVRRKLEKLAEQPNNYRAAKRARAIKQFLEDKKSKESIVAEANVAEASVRKWVDGYFADGLDGWRAYHTPVERIANYDDRLTKQLEAAIKKVRRINLEPSRNGATLPVRPKRLYMNAYVLELQKRFGQFSVAELIECVEEELGHGVGTVYVGDLLAICDVVLDESSSDE